MHFGARLNTVQRQVGFPRRADTPSNRAGAGRVEIDGTDYRSRDLRSEDEPAPTVTEKARSWRVLNTGRDWKEGGDRDDAQTIDPAEQPAPAVTAKSGGQWRLVANRQANAAVRSLDEPAPTITGGHDTADRVWIVDTGETRGQGEVTTDGRVRSEDEPAPVLTSRADQMQWTTERPATTMQGDARVFSPGEHRNADRPEAPGRSENAIRVEPWEAGVLQGFPPDYPWSGRTITAIFQQIGNAIPPQLAHAILAEVIGA